MVNIEETSFGWIRINGKRYDHDVVVYEDGEKQDIIKRKKRITKRKHGTSHKFTREEMETYIGSIDTDDIDKIIVGTGQYGKLGLLPETKELLDELNIEYIEKKTPQLVELSKQLEQKGKIYIIHLTC